MGAQLLDLIGERWVRLLIFAAIAVGAAVAYGVGRRRAARIASHLPGSDPCDLAPETGSQAAEVLQLLGDVRPGLRIGGFDVVQVYAPDRGAIPIVLGDDAGARVQLNILRRDPDGPPAPAETERLALYVTGVPRGSRTTRAQVEAARTLAEALSGGNAEPPAWLATLRTRPS
jgi:hypothetical protein